MLSIETFMERNLMSRSAVYKQIAEGKLIAHKFGKKSGIYQAEEARWRAALPRVAPVPNHHRRKHSVPT